MDIPVEVTPSNPKSVAVRSSSLQPASLDARHRCDSCGARAYACAMISSGRRGLLPLYFCGHHFTAWETRIREAAVSVLDERWHLRASVKAQKAA